MPVSINNHILEKTKDFESPVFSKPKLIFIAGAMGRTGTNFLARLLLAHPDVCRPAGHWEFPLFDVAEEFAAFHSAFLQRRGKGRLDYSLEEFAVQFGQGIQQLFYERVADSEKNSKFLLSKNPATKGIEHFKKFFPDAKLIFIIRDGRDTVNSLLRAAGYSEKKGLKRQYFFIQSAKNWAESARRIMNYRRSSETECIVVRFEELHQNCEEVLEQIARHTNLPSSAEWLEQALQMPVTGTNFHTSAESSADAEKVRTYWKEINKTEKFQPIGRWKNSWSAIDKKLFYKIAGEELKEFGYL